MLIIVEGPDGAGKSTLCRELVRVLDARGGAVLLKRGVPERHPLDEYARPLWDYRPGSGFPPHTRHVVCDRWHLGEVVYPAVTGRPTALDAAVRWYVGALLRVRGAVLVLCSGDPEVLGHPEDGDNPAHLGPLDTPEVTRRFEDELLRLDVLPNRFVWNRRWDASTVADVLDLAATTERDAAPLAPFVTYVGPPRPRPAVLLLGERRLRGEGTGPAFGPYPGTSGRYLLRALTASATSRDLPRVGLANARDEDDAQRLWWTLGSPPVVALGNLAYDAAAPWATPLARVPHPQYVRRFQHRRLEDYGRAVLAAAGTDGPYDWDLEEGWPNTSRRSYQDWQTLPEV